MKKINEKYVYIYSFSVLFVSILFKWHIKGNFENKYILILIQYAMITVKYFKHLDKVYTTCCIYNMFFLTL